MKKLSILFILLFFTKLHAQLPTILQYKTQQANAWQTLLSGLNSSGSYVSDLEILYDKVTPFAGLYTFNEADNNGSNTSHFKQALNELYNASNQLKFESSLILQNKIQLHQLSQQLLRTQSNYTPIIKMGLINTTMSYLNYNPEFPDSGGVKLVNGVYVPANNLPVFIEKQVTIVSPLEELVLTPNNSVIYKFDATEIYQWGNKKIANLTANFGNGVTNILIQNQQWINNQITINYAAVDENKLLTFNFTFTDGTTLSTYSGISIGSNTTVNNSLSRGISGLMKHISSNPDANGALGQLEYRIFYGDQNTNNIIKKPFIIVDGFDPGDKRKIVKVDCNEECQKLFKPYDPLIYESIETLMLYNEKKKDLKAQLIALNYDVIIVNFPTYTNNLGQKIDGGADDIFRNGRTVASFLQKINVDIKNNGSVEKLVLVGPSMGGQITRYALAYMEKKQQETNNVIWNHNTRLWLSMDSPHQGATIPLATQGDLYFLGELLGKDEARSKYRDIINSKAAKQMLLAIAGSQTNFYNTDHDVYNQELITSGVANSRGYPILNGIRKIAITNGSLSGIKNLNPSEKFYEVVALAKLRSILTLGIRIAKIPVFRINNWFMSEKNSTSRLLHDYSREPSGDITWDHTNNLWMGSLDAVPGGSLNSANDLKEEVYSSLKGTNAFGGVYYSFPLLWTGERLIVEQRIPNDININITPQSFIPTHSGLDTNGFVDWYQPINKNLVCAFQTPFDTYYGENTNMPHITFTDNMVSWLLKELSGNPQPPSFPLQENLLAGPAQVCNGVNTTYNFSDICKVPGNANWVVTPNLQIVSTTGTSVTVKSLTGGKGIITANFINSVQSISKNIWSGVPSLPQILSYTNIPYDSTLQNGPYWNPIWQFKSIDSNDLTQEFIFKDLFGNVILSKYANNGAVEVSASEIGITYGQTQSFYVHTKNACGEINLLKKSLIKFTIYYPTQCQYGIGNGCSMQRVSTQNASFYKIFPNPSNSIINIALTNQNNAPTTSSIIRAELYDIMNQLKRSVLVAKNIASINVSGLPKGIYVLKINIDGNIESHQVAVE
jgi:Secretion system C-terminal sorting domain/Putative serine esterase (DUF676)